MRTRLHPQERQLKSSNSKCGWPIERAKHLYGDYLRDVFTKMYFFTEDVLWEHVRAHNIIRTSCYGATLLTIRCVKTPRPHSLPDCASWDNRMMRCPVVLSGQSSGDNSTVGQYATNRGTFHFGIRNASIQRNG